MKCGKCGKRMKIINTFQAGDSVKTQTAQCPICRDKHTIVAVVIGPADEFGRGAYAVAEKLKRQGGIKFPRI